MNLFSKDLKDLEIIDGMIQEPEGYSDEKMDSVIKQLTRVIRQFLEQVQNMDLEELPEKRYQRFRKF